MTGRPAEPDRAGRPRPAVDSVSLGLRAGDIGVLIGPSGCGKTTLLRAIAGLEPASSGTSTSAPLFTNQTGGRLVYITAYKTVRRLARTAGLAAADHITPHSLRHTFVTEALAAGAPLQDVQDAAGHADPRTTRRYDRTRKHHDNHPTYKLLTHLRREPDAGR